jgi:hypothetical protein
MPAHYVAALVKGNPIRSVTQFLIRFVSVVTHPSARCVGQVPVPVARHDGPGTFLGRRGMNPAVSERGNMARNLGDGAEPSKAVLAKLLPTSISRRA